jgi:hypothetical protein
MKLPMQAVWRQALPGGRVQLIRPRPDSSDWRIGGRVACEKLSRLQPRKGSGLPLQTLESCSRVKLPMHSLEPLLIDMCVNLRSGNVRVAQHFLDDAQVGTIA